MCHDRVKRVSCHSYEDTFTCLKDSKKTLWFGRTYDTVSRRLRRFVKGDTILLSRLQSSTLTLSLDGGRVDGVVGVAAQEVGAQQVLADAAGGAGQVGGVQVEGLPRLHRKLGAAAVPDRYVMATLEHRTEEQTVSDATHPFYASLRKAENTIAEFPLLFAHCIVCSLTKTAFDRLADG